MSNLYRQFLDLIPDRPLEVGTVTIAGANMATVELPGGGIIQARGQATAGQRVFVRDGAIESTAPSLTYIEGEA
jgi:cystathionine beta-lyase family protein involved in aluminum resistance